MESLDRAFENVCELDLVFHFDEVCFKRWPVCTALPFTIVQVHHILAEIIQGGLVLETNLEEIDSSGKSPLGDEKRHAFSCACTCVRASIRLVFLSSGTFLRPTDSERGALAHAISCRRCGTAIDQSRSYSSAGCTSPQTVICLCEPLGIGCGRCWSSERRFTDTSRVDYRKADWSRSGMRLCFIIHALYCLVHYRAITLLCTIDAFRGSRCNASAGT